MLYLEARVQGKPVRWRLPSRGHVVVGRGRECEVSVEDDSISRRHATVSVSDGNALVEDLGSTNGLWLRKERVKRFDAEPDVWFVAGNVLMTVRRGVTLTSTRDSTGSFGASPGPVNHGFTQEPPTSPPDGGDDRAGFRALERSIALLDADEDPEISVGRLLEAVAQRHAVRTVALLERVGGGWSLAALSGASAPEEVDEPLEAIVADGPVKIETSAGPVLYCPISSGSAVSACLLLHPWPHANGKDELLAFVQSVCAWWIRLRAPGVLSTVPPSQPEQVRERAGLQFLAASATTRALVDEVDRLARASLAVILVGETGTGKELLARRLHEHSPRAGGRFVAINCAAIPRELLEAELFGIERGVATGVDGRKGKFLLASRGTLFLDEIADMPLELQSKLLRALETNEVTPVGAETGIPVDVRVVAATHRDLSERVKQGTFREDLLHRLQGAVVEVPGLRARREEVLPLARRFARLAAGDQGRSFEGLTPRAARCLLGYRWPGNVRELRNAMARAVALADGPILDVDLLPRRIVETADERLGDAVLGLWEDYRTARTRFETMYFTQLLERCRQNHSEAARKAGLSRSNLYRKLEELGLRHG